MKQRKNKSGFSFVGAVLFFVLIALIIQIAVLTYDYIQKRTQDKPTIALLMLLIILMLSALCTSIDIIRRKYMVDRPVEEILRATERISKGDFAVRLSPAHPYGKYDEYDVIKENLNAMASELEKSEILKTDFISNVSHELKTPLTIIKSYAVLLGEEGLDAETRKKYAVALAQASARLSDLITNILKLNKLENQGLRPEYEEIDLASSLGESVLQFEEIFEEKGVELLCDFEDGVRIYSASAYLEIVWNNLISNAVKFTDKGGRVEVSVKKSGENAVVTVRDTGCGISPQTGARIFEKFYQGETSRAKEGNGLGLALVKRVIDLIGGKISVKSEEGKGSTFTVVLKDAVYEK